MAVTMEDVAARANVSRALVSLVMRDSPKVSEAKRRAVLAAAAELGYRPNLIARQLASASTKTIGVLASDLHNPLFAELLDVIDRQTTASDYRLLLAPGFRDAARERAATHFLQDHRVDGIILDGPYLGTKAIQELAGLIPVAVIGPRIPGVDCTSIDDVTGTALAMDHLFELGHRDIAHIDGGTGAGASRRRATYRSAMRDRGLADRIRVVAGDYTEDGGRRAARDLLTTGRMPTAIFAANDLSAIGALQQARCQGVPVPGGLSVVGFDNSYLAQAGYVSLTTIDQPREQGAIAVRLLVERIESHREEPRHVLVPPSLVIRSTTAPPPDRPRLSQA